MNFLAHLYLSGESDEILIGNFIGDYVKGRKYLLFPKSIQRGILMHRQIDAFTDEHPLVKQCKQRFKEGYGRYAGIVVDVVFDHYLANNWENYSDVSLNKFTKHVHRVLLQNYGKLPARVQQFLPFLIQHKRLESYAYFSGIEETLMIMGRRTSLPEESEYAIQIMKNQYNEIGVEFYTFFADLVNFVETKFKIRMKGELSPLQKNVV